MRLHVCKIDENREIVLGKVVEVEPKTNCTYVTIEGEVWDKEANATQFEKIKIGFWNNDTVKHADNVIKAKVEVGSIIAASIYRGKDGRVSGNGFRYNGSWTFPAEGEKKERNIFMGYICSPRDILADDGSLRGISFSIPVNKGGNDETYWAHIAIWNSDTHTTASSLKKILENSKGKVRAVIVCGEKRENNGYDNYTGYQFHLY